MTSRCIISLGNPGLVIAGSGRSADVLAEAYRLSTPEEAINKDGLGTCFIN